MSGWVEIAFAHHLTLEFETRRTVAEAQAFRLATICTFVSDRASSVIFPKAVG
jgi:hypothetical protein